MVNTLDDIISAVEPIASRVPQIADTTNFWMIRSKQGVFYSEYVEGNFIAIGWNALSESVLTNENDDEYYKQILKDNSYPDKVPGTALNKCRRFVEEIKDGDIAMIVGRTEIAFAIIKAYFEESSDCTTAQKELEVHAQIESGTYLGLNCPYRKRRHVSIISKVDLDCAPPMIYKCLVSNRHSLSSLNDYADAILSCCYDLSYYSNRLILKYHVRQPHDINPIDFSLFTLSIATLIADDNKKITGKYNLNSEGDIVLFLVNQGQEVFSFIKEHLVPILLGYFILFGGKAAGIEFPSSIDKMKALASDFFYRKENKRIKCAEAAKSEAEATVSKAESERITAEAEKLKAETERIRIETDELKVIAKERGNTTVVNLSQASIPLNIRPPASNIIDISAVFEEYNEPD